MATPPEWFTLSHHNRYRKLQKVRTACVRNHPDIAGRTVYLDGRWIKDVPSFFLSMGEAVNGPGGYFGGI